MKLPLEQPARKAAIRAALALSRVQPSRRKLVLSEARAKLDASLRSGNPSARAPTGDPSSALDGDGGIDESDDETPAPGG